VRSGTRIAIAVRDDLAVWQRLNVTAFLASAVARGRWRDLRRRLS
jgi:hypothetical protein